MQLNVTCVIQMLNFIVTYVILREVLLRPFVHHIQKKTAAKLHLIAKLKDRESGLALLSNEKKDQLIAFQEYINKRYKKPLPTRFSSLAFTEKTLTSEELEHLTQAATQLLVTKVPHVS